MISSLPSGAPASSPVAARSAKPSQTSNPTAAPRDSASLSSEATHPGEVGSLPSFAARATPTRDLPYRMPRTETPEQKRTREKRNMKKVDEIERDMERRWKAHGGGIMKPTPGSPEARGPKLQASGLPHRMPKTETPQQRQARLDRECADLRKLHAKHQRGERPIMTPAR